MTATMNPIAVHSPVLRPLRTRDSREGDSDGAAIYTSSPGISRECPRDVSTGVGRVTDGRRKPRERAPTRGRLGPEDSLVQQSRNESGDGAWEREGGHGLHG